MTTLPQNSSPVVPAKPGSADFVIPVMQEEADIQTVREHVGTVRLTKRVHHQSVPMETTGYREVVETYRVPVGQVVDRVERPWQQDGATVIPVYEERLVRQLVLVEELHVVRRRSYDDGDTFELRQEELLVERLDLATGQWVADSAADPDGRPTK
jgi:hypothetical protein